MYLGSPSTGRVSEAIFFGDPPIPARHSQATPNHTTIRGMSESHQVSRERIKALIHSGYEIANMSVELNKIGAYDDLIYNLPANDLAGA